MTEPSDRPEVDPDAPEVGETAPLGAPAAPEAPAAPGPDAADPQTEPAVPVTAPQAPEADAVEPEADAVEPEADLTAPVVAPELPEPDASAPVTEVALHDAEVDGGGRPSGPAGASVVRNVVEWLTILGGAMVVALVVTRFLVQAFFIPSLSMFPALDEGDRVLVNKLSYRLHEINRGDLIVFERPSDEGPSQVKDLIKRVVGLEGERIEAEDGRVVVDGRILDEPYLAPGVETTNLEPVVVPAGHVFVMGDNRGDSRDSRFFGPLPEELVIGRAFVKVWPLDDLELL